MWYISEVALGLTLTTLDGLFGMQCINFTGISTVSLRMPHLLQLPNQIRCLYSTEREVWMLSFVN